MIHAIKNILRPTYVEILKHILPRFYISYKQPRIVFMTGMPRSGTTLAMRYFAKHPKISIVKQTYYHNKPLRTIAPPDHIALNKRTRSLARLQEIYNRYGKMAWFICIVRDPRDILLSLYEAPTIHTEVPRTDAYWDYWYDRWQSVFTFAQKDLVPVVWVRYEDLVTDPIPLKRSFQHWLSLPEADLTLEYDADAYYSVEGRGEDWKANQHGAVHQKSRSRWLSGDIPDDIQDVLLAYENTPKYLELMQRFGYTLTGYEQPNIDIKNFTILTL